MFPWVICDKNCSWQFQLLFWTKFLWIKWSQKILLRHQKVHFYWISAKASLICRREKWKTQNKVVLGHCKNSFLLMTTFTFNFIPWEAYFFQKSWKTNFTSKYPPYFTLATCSEFSFFFYDFLFISDIQDYTTIRKLPIYTCFNHLVIISKTVLYLSLQS